MLPGSTLVKCECGLRLYRRYIPNAGYRWMHRTPEQKRIHDRVMAVKERNKE